MNLKRFVDERSDRWVALGTLADEAGHRPERLSPDSVLRLGSLYRSATADLSLARQRFPHDPVVGRLEDLVGRSRHLVYDGGRRRHTLREFFSVTYWRLIGDRSTMLMLATLILFGPAILAALWAISEPATARSIVPGGFLWVTEPRPEGTDMGLSTAGLAGFSTFVFVNNIQVTLLAFALGVFWGVGTGWVLFQNGLVLGAVVGLGIDAGNGRLLVEALVGHGILELSCIVVAGAAGLSLGRSILRPGRVTRRRSLTVEAGASVQIVLGTAPWLVLAGLLEGFLSRVGLGPIPVTLVGVLVGGAFWGLVWWRGRPVPADVLA